MPKKPSRPMERNPLLRPPKPMPLNAEEMRVLDQADAIRRRHSETTHVNAMVEEIRSYAFESRHSRAEKLANLRDALAKTRHPEVRKAIEEGISLLERR